MILLKINGKLKSLSQNKYNNLVFALVLSDIYCNICNSNDWSYHCTYNRHIDIFNRKHEIKIQRIICNKCGKTHAILVEDMIPYSSASYDIVVNMMNKCEVPTSSSFLYFLQAKYNNVALSYEAFCLSSARNHPCLFIST